MTGSRVVVVTGASAGVGRATARQFAAKGWDVGLIARGREGLDAAHDEIERMGRRAVVAVADVSDAEAVDAAAARIERELGPIDVWVNNAMVSVFSRVTDMDAAEFRRVTEVTYLGYVHGTLAALRHMVPRDRGTILQVGSALAYRAIPLQSAYCACKHAIEGFTESLRSELMHDEVGVRVTMVHLPAVNTPQFTWSRSHMPRKARPVAPVFQPEVAADAIVHAATHHRREWFVGGRNSVIIVGNKMFPALGDRYLARKGFEGQQYDGARDPTRRDNLYEPVPGDAGAHGPFDDEAHHHSVQLWLDQHRRTLTAGAAALLVMGLGAWKAQAVPSGKGKRRAGGGARRARRTPRVLLRTG